ncbi:MAG: hypothetical protein NZ455_13890 [Bacteroidia bacterium]|nr:hypothetical protein [Bacteroidia bacterium]
MGVSLRSCPQGRRATGYAIASVLRCAPHWANAHPPHASRNDNSKIRKLHCITLKYVKQKTY